LLIHYDLDQELEEASEALLILRHLVPRLLRLAFQHLLDQLLYLFVLDLQDLFLDACL